ncbi:MAG: radical SAM protein [Candidatus Odinarchaeota archaeon]
MLDREIYIDELVISITRFCNLECDHCLRGDKQRRRIKDKYINALFQELSSRNIRVGCVTLTGGEPSLAIERIDYIADAIHHYRLDVCYWHIATNGTCKSRKFMDALAHLARNVDDPETCTLRISFDIHHYGQWEKEDFYQLQDEILFEAGFDIQLSFRGAPLDDRLLVNMGRAENWGRTKPQEFDIEVSVDNQISISLMMNEKGDLFSACDLSWEVQDSHERFYLGNIEEGFDETVVKYVKEKLDEISNS